MLLDGEHPLWIRWAIEDIGWFLRLVDMPEACLEVYLVLEGFIATHQVAALGVKVSP